jgi:formylglycine-generating enzyme required for sulfatase activity
MFRENNDIRCFLTVFQRAHLLKTSRSVIAHWQTAFLLGILVAFSCREPLAPVYDNQHDPANLYGKPDPPSNLKVFPLSTDTVGLAWKNNSTFGSGFEIESSLDGVRFSYLESANARDTSAVIGGIEIAGKRLFFRLRAKTELTYSQFSNIDTVDLQKMVFVKGGTFQMGSPDGVGSPDEHPSHSVIVKSYWIDQFEVTVSEYLSYCTATGRAKPPEPPWGWVNNHPIVNVSWDDASAYAQWAGKRLPTEAEWEYAAKGGVNSKGYLYSGSNNPDSVAWTHSNSGNSTHPVGLKAANEIALYDMSGNAWEWCQDWYHSNYLNAPTDGRAWLDPGIRRVYRGGGWRVYPPDIQLFRVTTRSLGDLGDNLYVSLGFRCAKDCSVSRK